MNRKTIISIALTILIIFTATLLIITKRPPQQLPEPVEPGLDPAQALTPIDIDPTLIL